MKIAAIGDIHGRVIWKQIIKKDNFDKIVFVGDYFDSFDVHGEYQINNFINIIEYKTKNPDRVVLLLGNHDYHYLDVNERYSGFQSGFQYEIKHLLKTALKDNLIQSCYSYKDILFTHAGITKTWCINNGINPDKDIEKQLNDLLIFKPNSFKFKMGANYSQTGDDICQSPIWVRPHSLLKDKVSFCRQVVGHTRGNNIRIKEGVAFIDCLDKSDEYLVINNGGKFESHSL